jgi:hypothetical protein
MVLFPVHVWGAIKLIIITQPIQIMLPHNSPQIAAVVILKLHGPAPLSIMMLSISPFTLEIIIIDGLYVLNVIRMPLTLQLLPACPPDAMPKPQLIIITGMFQVMSIRPALAIAAIQEAVPAKHFIAPD